MAACEGSPHVRLDAPTTITAASDALWDSGFLRRRVIVSADVTLNSMRLRGFVSGTAPYVLWFFFTNNADLVCKNCTIEHDCAGGNATYFLQDVGLEALSRGQVQVSEDGMRAWGTVPMRAQDAALGTTSGQLFENSTFICTPDAPPEPDHSVRPDTTLRPEETCQYAANEGRSYRGTQNFTHSGHPCRRWDEEEAVADGHTAARFPAAGLRDNFCRNPDDSGEVWCYTDGGPRREVCGVPLCFDSRTAQRADPPPAPDVRPKAVKGGDSADGEHERAAIIGITCTAAGVAVFAIVLVTCMAFWRLRRERRERSRARFDKFADSYPLPGHGPPLVISDTSSNAYWIQSQSTSADVGGPPLSARLLAEHQASFGTHLAGTTISGPLSQAFLHRALSFDRIPSAPHAPAETDSVQASIGTQVAEYMHVWTPPTRGRPEVTVSTPSGSGRWVPARTGLARASRGRAWSDGGDRTVPRTQDGSLPSTSAWTAFGLTPESPPTQLLEAQLEWLSSHNEGRLLGHLQLVPYLGLRVGGQGAVAFARHHHAAARVFAMKFFWTEDAFRIEEQAAQLPELRALMPPVEMIEERPETLAAATADMSWPLCTRPLPPVIVTEKGESLDDFVHRSAPDFFTSLQVMVHIAEKLQQLHAAGWTHRDLKPGNAIWLPSQNSWTLIDFGCAARIGEEAPLRFSLYYAPPEVVEAYDAGRETTPCAAAADVWALGVICWELLTKQRFYGARARSHTVIAQLAGRAELPTEVDICTDLCRRLGGSRICSTILAMLSRAPDHRPAVGDLLQQWKSVFSGADMT